MSDLYELLIKAETDAKSQPIHFLKHAAKVDETPFYIDFKNYDRVVCGFSGGKDSVAAVLHLLDCGVDPSKIELHHHLVDGRESTLMDWPVTESYCRKFAHAFGMKIYMSWKVGGFEREMLRNDSKTAPVAFDSEDGTVHILGGNAGKNGTRMKFPQVTANLTQRWCSSYIKISVCDRILMNEPRFQHGKTLVVTGERAEESASRAHYKLFEPDRADNRNGLKVQRFIDHARPVHSWKEAQVWDIMKRYKVNPHPAYWLGWGRTSCRNCIFNNANMWATVRRHMPDAFRPIRDYEEQFKTTIHRTKTVTQLADSGTPYNCSSEMLRLAESLEYYADIFVNDWTLPPGAFKEAAGPT